MANLKEVVGKIIEIIQDDDKFEAKFDANPAKAIEEVLGISCATLHPSTASGLLLRCCPVCFAVWVTR